MKDYDGKVRVVYMNMVVHPDAVQVAHQYGCAAAKQKHFLDFKETFWEKGYKARKFDEDSILKFSGDIGLDVQKLKADANSAECKKRVDDDMAELRRFRVNGTPNFFINGQHVGGRIPKPAFQKIIDEKIKIAEASGVSGSEYYEKEIMGKGVQQFRSKRDGGGKGGAKPPRRP